MTRHRIVISAILVAAGLVVKLLVLRGIISAGAVVMVSGPIVVMAWIGISISRWCRRIGHEQ